MASSAAIAARLKRLVHLQRCRLAFAIRSHAIAGGSLSTFAIQAGLEVSW